jgi:hypothetical protein
VSARQWIRYLYHRSVLRVQLEPRGTAFWAVVLLAGLGGIAGAVVMAGGH